MLTLFPEGGYRSLKQFSFKGSSKEFPVRKLRKQRFTELSQVMPFFDLQEWREKIVLLAVMYKLLSMECIGLARCGVDS